MKIIKSQLLFVLFLLVGSGFIFAQNIRYVMYFPTNNLSHKKASSRKAYFWNNIHIDGGFVVGNLNTEKDLTLESQINTIDFTDTVFVVGYGRNIVDESGRFVAIGRKVSSSSISHLNQINASSELSVNEIMEEVGLSQTATSYQLKILRANHLVKYVRKGQKVLYRIDDEHVAMAVKIAMEHISHN